MRFVALLLLSGCSQLWGVDEYRPTDADASSDATVEDAPGDAGTDASFDAGVDAFLDDAFDAEPDRDAGQPDAFESCVTTDEDGGVVLTEGTIENTRFIMNTPGVAVTIAGDVELRNVEIVVRERTADGLVLANSSGGSILDHVRVVFDVDDATEPIGDGIRIDGANNIMATDIEVAGMNLRINRAIGVRFARLDMVPPSGVGGVGAPSAVVEVAGATTVTVDGFYIHNGAAPRAIDCTNCANVDFTNGFVDIQASNWPFFSEIDMFVAVNQLSNTAIVGSRRGVFLSGGEWDADNVQVERSIDCVDGDFAFDVAASPDSRVNGVATQALCGEEPVRGTASISGGAITLEPIPTIEFCFERTGVVF